MSIPKALELPEDIKKMTFEEAMNELEGIVKALEDGKLSLEESLLKYERGSALNSYCQEKLSNAQMKVEKIAKQGEIQAISTEDF